MRADLKMDSLPDRAKGGKVKNMDEEIKRTLKKQLQLLSERSENLSEHDDLAELTRAMIELVDFLDPSVRMAWRPIGKIEK